MTRALAWLRARWMWLVGAVVAVWWALAERAGRRRAEARADLERDFASSERIRVRLANEAARLASLERGRIEMERARAEVKARVEVAAAERELAAVQAEHAETGAVTGEAQRLHEEMKRAGRL